MAGPSVTPGQREDVTLSENTPGEKRPVPLVDYVLNVMKFVDAILSNNSTDDHCKEFVTQKGLVPLLGILGLPNLPIDFPVSQACQSVASVCKSILVRWWCCKGWELSCRYVTCVRCAIYTS